MENFYSKVTSSVINMTDNENSNNNLDEKYIRENARLSNEKVEYITADTVEM